MKITVSSNTVCLTSETPQEIWKLGRLSVKIANAQTFDETGGHKEVRISFQDLVEFLAK